MYLSRTWIIWKVLFLGTPYFASKIIIHQEWMQTQALQAGWGLCISWAETTRSVIPFKQKSINWLRNRALNQIQTIKNPRTSGHQERVRVLSYTGRPQWKKKTFSFGHCPNHLNPSPLTPIRATWSFFLEVKIQDLGLKILYILYNILYTCNLKVQS